MSLIHRVDAVVEVTKEFTMESSHFLTNYKGPCSHMHGHSYKLQVTLKGTLDDRGIVVDFKELKAMVSERIVNKFDHEVINTLVAYNPTAENMVVHFWDVIKEVLADHLTLVSVKLWETATSYAEYRGECI